MDVLTDFHRIEDAERVGKHNAPDGQVRKAFHQGKYIVGVVLYAVAPVLEVDIDADAFLLGVVDGAANVGDVLFERLVQLSFAMLAASLAEEVHALATALHNPIHALRLVDKAEHLHPVELGVLACPTRDALHGLLLALRDTGTCHLDAVYAHILKQGTRYHELLVRHEAHAARLLTVAQGGVHYFNGPFHILLSCLCWKAGSRCRRRHSSGSTSCSC